MNKYCECEHISVSLDDHSDVIGVELSQFAGTITANLSGGDYNSLENAPSINGVILRGNMSASDIKLVLQNTTADWDSDRSLISEKGTLYVYLDHSVDSNGNNIPGIKIGDGKSYLIDMPFAMENVNISQADIDFWNNKWRGYIDPDDGENLVFTTL